MSVDYGGTVKVILAIAVVVSLTSCNTSIGIWRDTKAGFRWTKEKIQNSGNGGSGQDSNYGAPVY